MNNDVENINYYLFKVVIICIEISVKKKCKFIGCF